MNGVVFAADAALIGIREALCHRSWGNIPEAERPNALRALIATAEHPEDVRSLLEDIGLLWARVYWIYPALAGVGSEMYSSFVTKDGARVQITVLGRIYN